MWRSLQSILAQKHFVGSAAFGPIVAPFGYLLFMLVNSSKIPQVFNCPVGIELECVAFRSGDEITQLGAFLWRSATIH
jgi:hypothetical protein